MKHRILLVVGDRFSTYVQGKDAITLSNLKGLLALNVPLLSGNERRVLVPGQGLSDESVRDLLTQASQSPNLAQFDFSLWRNLPERASAALTHKHRPENILISTPVRMSQESFSMQLLIDEECELMRDHQSGQHVQGMIMIEAARQGMLAIVEQYFLPHNDIEYAFVLNDMSVQYNNFTFPLSASIESRILSSDLSNPRRLSFSTEATVRQCGVDVSSLTFTFSAMDKARIHKREAMMANKTQSSFLSYVDGQLALTEQQDAELASLKLADNF